MSKLGLHLLANHITSNGSSIVVGVAVNPGAVNSSIWRGSNSIVQWIARHVFLTSEQGSYPSVYAAVSPTIVVATRENEEERDVRRETEGGRTRGRRRGSVRERARPDNKQN